MSDTPAPTTTATGHATPPGGTLEFGNALRAAGLPADSMDVVLGGLGGSLRDYPDVASWYVEGGLDGDGKPTGAFAAFAVTRDGLLMRFGYGATGGWSRQTTNVDQVTRLAYERNVDNNGNFHSWGYVIEIDAQAPPPPDGTAHAPRRQTWLIVTRDEQLATQARTFVDTLTKMQTRRH